MFAQTNRIAREEQYFFRLARRHRFEVEILPVRELHADYRTGRSSIFTLRWRPPKGENSGNDSDCRQSCEGERRDECIEVR